MTAATIGRPPASAVFAALGDPNRQRLLELLADRGTASATTLSASLEVSRQAVDKHLRVLGNAGLVSSARAGREVLYVAHPEQLVRSAEWLSRLAARWDHQLEMIKAAAESAR